MSIVLPGELVPAQHVNLKLGPGLLQISNPKGSQPIISTRAGCLNHSANGSKWWVESNSRRVSILCLLILFSFAEDNWMYSMSLLHRNLWWVLLRLGAERDGESTSDLHILHYWTDWLSKVLQNETNPISRYIVFSPTPYEVFISEYNRLDP
jgi:hypothetical protein